MRVTERVHESLKNFVNPGDVVIDATAGNGHDTLFLAQLVGPTGHVFAFDIQQDALDATAKLLGEHRIAHFTAFRRDHAELADAIPAKHRGKIAAVVFNLGYLPGGNRNITTAPGSTFSALHAARSVLMVEGIICATIYRGHLDGPLEAEAVLEVVIAWSRQGDAVFIGPAHDLSVPQLVTAVKMRA